MTAHVLPPLLKLGSYELDKENFTLKHDKQRRDSSGRKRRIEYACDACNCVYTTYLQFERKKKFPWLCASCRRKEEWKTLDYRNALIAGITDETRNKHRDDLSRRSKQMWADQENVKYYVKKFVNVLMKRIQRDVDQCVSAL